ncbi:Concanavalin A-like lectin/glucanases superfamily/Beige/BEACH domain containing protein [Leishmania donovani]|nr:Concanavalin A-like lectin/glucanases superfamily/Beige/BEACH domain containing protein [Leishmania donovani]
MQSSVNSELQRLWLDARCTPPTAAQHNDKVSAFLSVFVPTFTSRKSQAFRALFGDGAALLGLLCRDFATLARRLTDEDATVVPTLATLATVRLFSQALRLLIGDDALSNTEVGRLASAYENFGNFNVVALALVLHNRLLHAVQTQERDAADWGAVAQTDARLLQLVSAVVSCRHKELTRRSMLEAILPERVASVARTAVTYFSAPEEAGVEAAEASSSILHQQLPNVLDADTVVETLRVMEGALVSSQRRPSTSAAAVWSFNCFACFLENIIYAKQLIGFSPVESLNFDVITATVLNLEKEVGEDGMPALHRVVGSLRVLALAERPDVSSRRPSNTSSLGSSFFRILPATVGRMQQRIAGSWGTSEQRETPLGVHCEGAVESLARLFVLSTQSQMTELCGQQLFQLLLMRGVSAALLGLVLSICAESAPRFEASNLCSLMAFVGKLPCKGEVGEFLKAILDHLRCGRFCLPEQRLAVVVFFIDWCPRASTHVAMSLALGVVQACVHCLSQLAVDPRADGLETFAEHFSVLAKVVLGSKEAADSLISDNCCASLLQVMLASLESGQLHTAVLLRDAFVGLVMKTNLFCDVLLEQIASATDADAWTSMATPLLSTLVLLLHSCGRYNRASLPHNCIELCLSLMQDVESHSQHPPVDRHLLGCCLSLLLTLVNYSDVWELVERTVGTLPANCDHVQSMIDLCTGVLRSSESLAMAERYFTEPAEMKERWSAPCFVHFGPFAVMEEPYIEMLYPVKLLVHMVDTMLTDQHTDAASGTEATEYLMLHSGVTVPNSYVADFIVRWERFTWIRCVSNVYDPKLLPLFFTRASTLATVQKCQRVWLEGLAESVATGEVPHHYNDYIHLGEGGGAKGLVTSSGVVWPPLDAYTAAMWVYMDPMPSGRHEGRVVLWQLEWDAMGRHVCLSLVAHTQRKCCLYRCDLDGDVTVVEMPALPEQRWVHVVTSHARGKMFASQLKMYFDGVEVACNGCPYPAGGLQTAAAVAASLPSLLSREVEVTIGSPQDTPSTQATLRLISFQLYGCGASLRQISSLYAMGPYPSGQVWDSAGQQVYDLHAPCLCDQVVRTLEASLQSASLESILREQCVVLAFPPTMALVQVHAFAMEQIDTSFGYLNNKQWALRNLAAPAMSVLCLHGYYRPPRDSRTTSVDALLCNGAFYEWMRWMRCVSAGVLAAERERDSATETDNSASSPEGIEAGLAAVQQTACNSLRVLNLIKKADMLPLNWQRFMVQFAEHATCHPQIYLHHATAVTQLLQLCMQTVRYRDKHGHAVDGQLLSNLLPLEHIFFNWRLLSNLPDDSWMTIIATLRQLVSPSNALAGLNTARLLMADFVNGFVLGLLREYVAFPRLVTAIELVKCVLLTSQATEELMERVLMAAVLTVPGPSQDGATSTVESHLGSKLATTSCVYLVLARNMLLRCLNEVLEMTLNDGNGAFLATFVSVVPDWWFTAMLSGSSHPVTATLTLRLFVLCFLNAKPFREACSATKAECISRAMEPHCHQRELMDVLVQGYMGHVWAPSSSHAVYSTAGWSGKTEMEGLLVLILHLLKAQCQLLLRGTPVTSEEVTVRGYFSAAAAEATRVVAGNTSPSAGRWRRVRLALAAVRRLKKAACDKKGAKAGGSVACLEAAVQYTASIDRLKSLVCEVLDWLTQSYHLSRALSKSLYQSNNSANLCDFLMWPVLVALCSKEPISAQPRASVELPNRARAKEEDDTAASSSGASTDVDEEEEEEQWEVLPDPTTYEARSFGLDSMGPTEGMEKVYDACMMFFLTYAGSRASNASFLTIAGGRTTMSKYVLSLHRALSAEVKGAGNHAEDARKAFLCFVWLKASEQAVGGASDVSAAAVKRNAVELGKYMLDRLVSGGAVPPAAIAAFYRFLLARLECDAMVVKSARTALFEWFMYVTSASFYKLDASKVGVVVDMAYSCADMLFSYPMPAMELLKVVVGRLLQVTVCLWNSIVDDSHPAIRKMAVVWKAVLCANEKNTFVASLFVCGSPEVDTFHNGFDLLLPPIASPEAFTIWMRQHHAEVAQLLQSYMGLSYAFVMANGGEHLRLITRHTTSSLAEWDRRRRHVAAMVAAHWQLWKGTFMTTTFVDPALLACTVSRYPHYCVFNGGGAAVDAEVAVCCEWSMDDNGAVGQTRRYVTENVDEVASDPLSFYIRYAPPVCLPLRRQEAQGPALMLRPNARELVAKVAGRGPSGSVVFVSNAYLVLGTESYISTCILTRQELLVVTCSVVTPAGDFFAEQVRVHTASQHSHAKPSLLQQAFRLFISGQGKGSGSTSSQAAFRYSQYYRQLQTESAKGSNALVWRFPLGSITSVHQRLFQHLSAGLEVVLESGKCVFLVLLDDELSFSKASRDRLFAYFDSDSDPLMSGIAAHSMSEKLVKLGIWTRRWVRRECSNYMYLRVLNDAASRTTANLGQYPVMPWVLSRYTESMLDLGDASAYRDLTKPVGALNELKAKQLQARYAEWIACDPVADPPYHYGTHYSTAAIVLYYLIRLQPFTSRAIRFQGGRLDIADRLFHSVAEAWANGSGRSRGDVKELIPEFFRVSDFLENRNDVCLGTRSDGAALGDVVLPPWCGGSAARFVYMNALSLESEAVSQQLHRWIDLIFGCNQVGQGAVEAINVFSPLSYKEGVVRAINHAATEEERKSIVASADNFGQTPLQLFSKEAHPARKDALRVRTTQAYMLEAVTDITSRPCLSAQVVGKCEGGISTAFVADDTLFLCDRLSAVGSAKPPLLFTYDRDVDSIVCTTARRDRVLATIPQVRSSGSGCVRCLCASVRGSVVCVGTDSGKVIVYSRESCRHRFFIVAVLDSTIAAVLQEAGPVSSLHLFDEGNLLVAYERVSAVSGWHLSILSTNFTFAASFATQADSTAVKAISADSHTGLYYAAKANSLVIFSASGVMLTQLKVDALLMSAAPEYAARIADSRITALLFANCSSFAFTNLVLMGHFNGTVSLWCVAASQTITGETPSSEAPLWSFRWLHEVVFDAPVTCLAASAEELSFVVGLANRTAHYISFPTSGLDSS